MTEWTPAAIYEFFAPQVERWVRGYSSKKALRHEFDDLLGVANLRFVEMVDKFGPDVLADFQENVDKFSVYIRLSIQTAMSDYLRQYARHDHQPLNPMGVIDHSGHPLNLIEEERRILDCIKDRKDALIIQAKLEGARTAKDVSTKTGIPRNTIYRRLRAMRERYDKQP